MTTHGRRRIEGSTSVVLDGLRLLAALTVLITHVRDVWLPDEAHVATQPGDFSHAAVVVFFVLSGFVIAYTTSQKQRGLSSYLQARAGRLSSMLIPALLLAAVVELLVRYQGNPDLVGVYVRGAFGPRYVLTGLFMNELWFFSSAPPVDGPLWSIGFEFWYYVIFGIWYCTGRGLKACAWALIACLIAGPKILLLMPIWLMGCAAYLMPRPALGRAVSWTGVVLALGAAGCAVVYLQPYPYELGQKPLFFANQFVTDWVIGLPVAAALWLLPETVARPANAPGERFIHRLRVAADLTFPIYVLHQPIMVLFLVVFGLQRNDLGQLWVAGICILVVASLIGFWLDRQRSLWMRFYKWLFASVEGLVRRVTSR